MAEATVSGEATALVRRAHELESTGDLRAAIELLSHANRAARHADLERALVHLRRRGGSAMMLQEPVTRPRITATPADALFEIEPAELTDAALRAGFSQCGCVLVRGLVPPERIALLVDGIDAAMAAFDAATDGASYDPAWFDPGPMPDRVSPGLPASFRRKFLRADGGLWTVDSPRMLFEVFELVDDTGLGALMTEFLGERPLLSAIKGTLRRVPPTEVIGGWHQDGAFLGDHVGSFNFWLALTACGRDAPGLDIVAKRFDRVVPSDPDAQFDWSLSDAGVLAAADGAPIVRPDFAAGDAMLFDHLLLHRTAASTSMTRARHAIESWFFAPSAYPVGQLPILY
ncbi:MAG: phytanoyl-CoA dioxygenase family protein [Acidimicrobiales bacterium]